MNKTSFLLAASLFLSGALAGQSYELGLYGGGAYYDGDISPNRLELYFQTLRPAFGGFARFNTAGPFSFRLGYIHTSLVGDDNISDRKWRVLSFETTFDELAAAAEFHLFRLRLFGGDFYVEPYVYGGLSVFRFDPQARYEGRWVALQPLGTEGQGLPGYGEKYSLVSWSALGGGGAKMPLGRRWILGFEATARRSMTDYIDDVSDTKVNYQKLLEGNGELAAKMSYPNFVPRNDNYNVNYRRGGGFNDYIFSVGATLSFLFGDGKGSRKGRFDEGECPTF